MMRGNKKFKFSFDVGGIAPDIFDSLEKVLELICSIGYKQMAIEAILTYESVNDEKRLSDLLGYIINITKAHSVRLEATIKCSLGVCNALSKRFIKRMARRNVYFELFEESAVSYNLTQLVEVLKSYKRKNNLVKLSLNPKFRNKHNFIKEFDELGELGIPFNLPSETMDLSEFC